MIKKTLKWVAIGFIAFLVLGAIFGGKSNAPETEKVVTEEVITEKVTEEAKPVVKQWVSIVELEGNANKNSDTFRLTGGKARITYNFTGNTMIGAIYVMREGTDLMEDGGIPEVMVTEAGEDSTIIRKSAGEYYLQVNSANTDYIVTIEEEK